MVEDRGVWQVTARTPVTIGSGMAGYWESERGDLVFIRLDALIAQVRPEVDTSRITDDEALGLAPNYIMTLIVPGPAARSEGWQAGARMATFGAELPGIEAGLYYFRYPAAVEGNCRFGTVEVPGRFHSLASDPGVLSIFWQFDAYAANYNEPGDCVQIDSYLRDLDLSQVSGLDGRNRAAMGHVQQDRD